MTVDRGYCRLTATDAGRGATAVLRRVRATLVPGSDTEIEGTVTALFDRTVYLSVPVAVGRYQSSTVALSATDLRAGPLLARLMTPVGFSFRRHCQLSSACRLRTDGSGGLVVTVGPTLVVDIRSDILDVPTADTKLPFYSVRRFTFGSELVETHLRLLSWLVDSGVSDGIGHLDALHAVRMTDNGPVYESVPPSFVGFVSTVVTDLCHPATETNPSLPNNGAAASVRNVSVHDQSTPRSYLGCGPGATPAGDDILAGLLLVFSGLSDTWLQPDLKRFTDQLIAEANGRSTAASCALLEQAAYGRGADLVESCLRSLVAPQPCFAELKRDAERVLAIGHTSGAATLAGMLTATMLVLPHIQQNTGKLLHE